MGTPLFLSSTSPRRIEILNQFNVPFETIENKLKQEPLAKSGESPTDYVVKTAIEKVNASKKNHNGIILGCDTIVTFKGEILGKPKTKDKAIEMLSQLAGETHQVVTACALFNSIKNEWDFCIDYATVTFKDNCTSQIKRYVKMFHPMDKAGGYGIQDQPSFLSGFSGDYYTIMGLPINRLLKLFSHYGIVKSC